MVEERWSAECMGMERREWKRGERACKREGLNYSNEPRMRERGALVLGASKRCVVNVSVKMRVCVSAASCVCVRVCEECVNRP